MVLELNIESRDYDFLNMAGQIGTWCVKNQITPKVANRVRLVFEEIMGLLIPALKKPQVQAVCEYSAQTEQAEWSIWYGGPRYDLSTSGNDIALAVLRGMTEKEEYIWDDGTELKNRIRLIVKKD